MASRRSVVASTLASSPRRSTMFWTRSRELRSLPGSMSIREIVLSCRAGASRISEHRLRVKTALPAPMRVIFGTGASFLRPYLTDVTCTTGHDQGLELLMNACVLGAARTAAGALLDPNLLALHRQDRAIPLRDSLRRT